MNSMNYEVEVIQLLIIKIIKLEKLASPCCIVGFESQAFLISKQVTVIYVLNLI